MTSNQATYTTAKGQELLVTFSGNTAYFRSQKYLINRVPYFLDITLDRAADGTYGYHRSGDSNYGQPSIYNTYSLRKNTDNWRDTYPTASARDHASALVAEVIPWANQQTTIADAGVRKALLDKLETLQRDISKKRAELDALNTSADNTLAALGRLTFEEREHLEAQRTADDRRDDPEPSEALRRINHLIGVALVEELSGKPWDRCDLTAFYTAYFAERTI
jgi:hypothetical protein